jgi:hypothetical protein
MVSLTFPIASLRSCSCSKLLLPHSRPTPEGEDLLECLLIAIQHRLDAETLPYHLPAQIGIYLFQAPSTYSPHHLIPLSIPCQYSYLSIFDYCAPVQRRFLKDGLVSDACRTWGLHVSTRYPIPHGEFYLCVNLPISPVKRFDLWMVQTTQSGIRQRVTDDAADTDQPAAGAGCTPRTRGGTPVKALCWEGELGVRLRPAPEQRLHTGNALRGRDRPRVSRRDRRGRP